MAVDKQQIDMKMILSSGNQSTVSLPVCASSKVISSAER
jgi:hypothetical protein